MYLELGIALDPDHDVQMEAQQLIMFLYCLGRDVEHDPSRREQGVRLEGRRL